MCLCKYGIIFIVVLIEVYSQKNAEQNIQSYESCQKDTECKSNAFCFGNDHNQLGKCKCEVGYELLRNVSYYECLPSVKLEGACEKDIQCQFNAGPQAFCNTWGLCDCKNGSQAKDGFCYILVELGEICLHDNNCYLGDNRYGSCVLGRCNCPLEYRPSSDGKRCIVETAIGANCRSNEECAAVPNAVCSGICKCPTDHTPSRDETECVKVATSFGEDCTFDGQCSKFLDKSVCTNNQCTCLEDSRSYGNRCIRTKKLGEKCDENAECLPDEELQDLYKCTDGVCRCTTGKEDGGSCTTETKGNNSAILHTLSINTMVILTVFILMAHF